MNVSPPAQLLAPWLQRGSIAMLHAQPKTGKTYLALAVAAAVSEGKPLLGWQPDKPGKPRSVLYIDAEMPMWLMNKRLRQLGSPQNIHILSREQFLAGGIPMPDLGSEGGLEYLGTLIDHLAPNLVVLDSLSALLRSGEENERSSWLPMEAWLQTQRARKRAVLMVHHQGKTGSQRGTSAREEVLDASLALRKADKDGLLNLTIERIRDHEGRLERNITVRLKFYDDGKAARWVRSGERELSPTRAKVLKFKQAGLSDQKIAYRIGISRPAVVKHRSALSEAGLLAG